MMNPEQLSLECRNMDDETEKLKAISEELKYFAEKFWNEEGVSSHRWFKTEGYSPTVTKQSIEVDKKNSTDSDEVRIVMNDFGDGFKLVIKIMKKRNKGGNENAY